jgi:hypothetical protein
MMQAICSAHRVHAAERCQALSDGGRAVDSNVFRCDAVRAPS